MSLAKRAYLNITDETDIAKAIMERIRYIIDRGVQSKTEFTVTDKLLPTEKDYFEFGGHGEMLAGAIKVSRNGKQSWEERDFYIFQKMKGLEAYPVYRLIAKGGDYASENLATAGVVLFDAGKLAGIYDVCISKGEAASKYSDSNGYNYIQIENASAMLEALDKFYSRHLDGYAQQFDLATRVISGR